VPLLIKASKVRPALPLFPAGQLLQVLAGEAGAVGGDASVAAELVGGHVGQLIGGAAQGVAGGADRMIGGLDASRADRSTHAGGSERFGNLVHRVVHFADGPIGLLAKIASAAMPGIIQLGPGQFKHLKRDLQMRMTHLNDRGMLHCLFAADEAFKAIEGDMSPIRGQPGVVVIFTTGRHQLVDGMPQCIPRCSDGSFGRLDRERPLGSGRTDRSERLGQFVSRIIDVPDGIVSRIPQLGRRTMLRTIKLGTSQLEHLCGTLQAGMTHLHDDRRGRGRWRGRHHRFLAMGKMFGVFERGAFVIGRCTDAAAKLSIRHVADQFVQGTSHRFSRRPERPVGRLGVAVLDLPARPHRFQRIGQLVAGIIDLVCDSMRLLAKLRRRLALGHLQVSPGHLDHLQRSLQPRVFQFLPARGLSLKKHQRNPDNRRP
jgi:hypothetical protein